MRASEIYAVRVASVEAQLARLSEEAGPDFWGRYAEWHRQRFDPHRDPTPELEAIASYIRQGDVVVDVGGGAGRYGLPLALRCREVVNVESSPGACDAFEASAAAAGIRNVRCIRASWLDAEAVEGDVTLAVNVTYYMRDIVPFLEKMEAAARRRVMIVLSTWTALYQYGALFRVAFEEEMALWPNFPELLSVLWEMGILPDLDVLPPHGMTGSEWPRTPEEAVQLVVQGLSPAYLLGRKPKAEDHERIRARVEAHFDELFRHLAADFRPVRWQDQRDVLITWEAGQRLLRGPEHPL